MNMVDPNIKKEKHVNLQKMTLPELDELLTRQLKLINNKSFLSRLPDKGSRIQLFKSQIDEEIKRRNELVDLSQALSQIDLNGVPEEIEWTGQMNASKRLDHDDDDSDTEVDPLKLIATHQGTQKSRIKKEIPAEESLVTGKDVIEANSFPRVPYTDQMCEKYDKIQTSSDRFKPCEPKIKDEVKTGFKKSSENVRTKLGSHWEVTAATPPVPVHGDTKCISLAESLSLQKEQARRLKEIQIMESCRRLKETSGIKMDSSVLVKVYNDMKYRKPPDPCFEGTAVREVADDEHLQLDEENERDGAVFYNIVDDIPEKS